MHRSLLLAYLLLAACGDRPAAPSSAENRQLNEAEAMLDEMENEAAAD